VNGQQDAGGGASVGRLDEHLGSLPWGKLQREKGGMHPRYHNHGPFRRYGQGHAIECVAQQGPGTRENCILLGASVGINALDERT
jgi:hypothetical protein